MDQHYDEFFENAMKASDKGKFVKLPRYRQNLKYNFDGLYSYHTKIANLDLPGRTITKLGRWSVTSTMHYNYARRLLEDRHGFREILLD
jgi:hypothetical protein